MKKLIILVGLLLGMALIYAISVRKPVIRVIPPATEQELVPLRNFLADESNNVENFYDDLEHAFYAASFIYYADVNNDGIKEYVIGTYEGSAGIFTMTIAVPVKEAGFTLLDMSYVPEARGPFSHALTKREEFMLEYQGITYFCFDTQCWGIEGTRTLYKWDGESVIGVCTDDFWMQDQLRYADELHKARRYDILHPLLDSFSQHTRNKIDPIAQVAVRGKVARAAYNDGYPNRCRDSIIAIKSDPVYAHMSQEFKNGINRLELLCGDELALKGSPSYDYEWLLDFDSCVNNESNVFDMKDWNILMRQTVPDIVNPKGGLIPWRCEIASYLTGMIPSLKIIDQRYVIFDSFKAHRGGVDHGFFWCDIKNKVSVAAIGSKDPDSKDAQLYVTSRNLLHHELPAAFLESLSSWIREEEIVHDLVRFYDRYGSIHDVSIIRI